VEQEKIKRISYRKDFESLLWIVAGARADIAFFAVQLCALCSNCLNLAHWRAILKTSPCLQRSINYGFIYREHICTQRQRTKSVYHAQLTNRSSLSILMNACSDSNNWGRDPDKECLYQDTLFMFIVVVLLKLRYEVSTNGSSIVLVFSLSKGQHCS